MPKSERKFKINSNWACTQKKHSKKKHITNHKVGKTNVRGSRERQFSAVQSPNPFDGLDSINRCRINPHKFFIVQEFPWYYEKFVFVPFQATLIKNSYLLYYPQHCPKPKLDLVSVVKQEVFSGKILLAKTMNICQ